MNISYNRNQMDLVVDFLRNANPAAERFTSDELRDRIEEAMADLAQSDSAWISTLGFIVVKMDFYLGQHYFHVYADLSVCLDTVRVTVEK